MQTSAIGISTLLKGIAAEATQTRLQFLRSGTPFHIPELGVDLKVALAVNDAGDMCVSLPPAGSKTQAASSGIQARFISLETTSQVLQTRVHNINQQGDQLTVQLQLVTANGEPLPTTECMPVLEVNIERTLAATLNGRELGDADSGDQSYIVNPYVAANDEGLYVVDIMVVSIDSQARFPLVVDVCGHQEVLLIQA